MCPSVSVLSRRSIDTVELIWLVLQYQQSDTTLCRKEASIMISYMYTELYENSGNFNDKDTSVWNIVRTLDLHLASITEYNTMGVISIYSTVKLDIRDGLVSDRQCVYNSADDVCTMLHYSLPAVYHLSIFSNPAILSQNPKIIQICTKNIPSN